MAEGIRIRHTDPTVRGCVLLVPVKKRFRKDIPIRVDGTGHSIVSTGVWDELVLAQSQGHDHGFVIEHAVGRPPDLVIGFGGRMQYWPTKRLEAQAIADIAPRGTRVTVKR